MAAISDKVAAKTLLPVPKMQSSVTEAALQFINILMHGVMHECVIFANGKLLKSYGKTHGKL